MIASPGRQKPRSVPQKSKSLCRTIRGSCEVPRREPPRCGSPTGGRRRDPRLPPVHDQVPDDRDGFARALADEHGVGTGVYYPIPSHRLPSFDRALDLPETERAAREVLSLPVHPALSADALAAIVTAVNAVAAAGS